MNGIIAKLVENGQGLLYVLLPGEELQERVRWWGLIEGDRKSLLRISDLMRQGENLMVLLCSPKSEFSDSRVGMSRLDPAKRKRYLYPGRRIPISRKLTADF